MTKVLKHLRAHTLNAVAISAFKAHTRQTTSGMTFPPDLGLFTPYSITFLDTGWFLAKDPKTNKQIQLAANLTGENLKVTIKWTLAEAIKGTLRTLFPTSALFSGLRV